MASPRQQNQTSVIAVTTSQPLAFTLNVTAGSTLYAVTACDSTHTSTVADNVNGSYTQLESILDAAGGELVRTFKFDNSAGGAITVTHTITAGNAFAGLWIFEVIQTSGLVGHTGQLQSNPVSTAADAITSGSVTPSAGPGLLIGLSTDISGATTPVLGTNFTAGAAGWNFGSGTNAGLTESKRYTSPASLAATFTSTTTADDFITVVAFFADSSAGTEPQSRPRRPLRLGTPLSRLRGEYDDTNISVVFSNFNGSSASTGVLSLSGSPGTLGFRGASASTAIFSLSAGIGFSGSSASAAAPGFGTGMGFSAASASSAVLSLSGGLGIAAASASSATFGISAAFSLSGSSASSAIFNLQPLSTGPNFTGSSTSAAVFPLSASISFTGASASTALAPLQASLNFSGSSASSAFAPLSGGIGFGGSSASAASLSFLAGIGLSGSSASTASLSPNLSFSLNGSSASTAFVDVQGLSPGSMFFAGVSGSSVSIQIDAPFTPPDIVPVKSGGLLPGVLSGQPKTAIELERGYKYPWQATGAPIVPSPYMGSSESLAPIAPQMLHVEQINAPTEDEALLLLMLLGASL